MNATKQNRKISVLLDNSGYQIDEEKNEIIYDDKPIIDLTLSVRFPFEDLSRLEEIFGVQKELITTSVVKKNINVLKKKRKRSTRKCFRRRRVILPFGTPYSIYF